MTGPLGRALEHFPVVLLTGARQVGKSTLAEALVSRGRPERYLTLDDRTTLDAALRDPDGFVQGLESAVVIDEVQRAPDLMRAIKLVVDRDRRPGRFLLTGSAHIGTLASVAETLTGRAAVLELSPLSWSEIARRPAPGVVDALFEARNASELVRAFARRTPPARRAEISNRILVGGFPTPALMKDPVARRLWFDGYRQTYLERDLRDLANVQQLPEFNRLLGLLALRTGQVVNASHLARDAGLPNTTARRYVDLLRQTYQVWFLPPYFANVGKSLVKAPKVYFEDPGLACHLAAVESWETLERQGRVGALVETWAASELRKTLSLLGGGTQLWYWRVHHGREVDFLLERGGEVVGIEAKWAARVDASDLAGLRECATALEHRFRLGVVLYGGVEALALDATLAAIPYAAFFGRDG
jgi:hypothetical protein